MWKYRSLLPEIDPDETVSLGEGSTPLIESPALAKKIGLKNLYLKLENLNPSGSYKDRFASVLVSLMRKRNQRICIATSSGNTGAALSAYCAAAGLKCLVVVVDGAPVQKIRQMQLYGATVCTVRGFGKDPYISAAVFDLLKKFSADREMPLPISAYHFAPEGMEGVQTLGYELMDIPGFIPDHIFCPAGGGGLTLSVARGIMVWANRNGIAQMPRVHCVQPLGNDTIASALSSGKEHANAVTASTTSISGLQVPNVLDGNEVISNCRLTGGTGFIVTDSDVYDYHKMLATIAGVFSEPAGAVALAAVSHALKKGIVREDEKVVCLVTGSGFKDMSSVDKYFNLPAADSLDLHSLKTLIETNWKN